MFCFHTKQCIHIHHFDIACDASAKFRYEWFVVGMISSSDVDNDVPSAALFLTSSLINIKSRIFEHQYIECSYAQFVYQPHACYKLFDTYTARSTTCWPRSSPVRDSNQFTTMVTKSRKM